MIENAAQHVCVADAGSIIAGPKSCDGDSGEGWKIYDRSGSGFELADSSGNCLADDGNGFVGIVVCGGYGSTSGLYWRIGTTTASGATLVNATSGECISYAYTYAATITMKSCASSDSEQLWYGGGSA
jgi:hypothetical protein